MTCHDCRYDSAGGAAAPVSALTGGAQSVGGGKYDRRCTLAHIKEETIGSNGAAAWVQVLFCSAPHLSCLYQLCA